MNDNESLNSLWFMTDASAVAVTFQGIPISESGLTLRIMEGRTETLYPIKDDEHREILAYEFQFWVEGARSRKIRNSLKRS